VGALGVVWAVLLGLVLGPMILESTLKRFVASRGRSWVLGTAPGLGGGDAAKRLRIEFSSRGEGERQVRVCASPSPAVYEV